MINETISPLRQRMIEEMTIRHFSTATQKSYIRAVKEFADFFGHPPPRPMPRISAVINSILLRVGLVFQPGT